MSYNEVRFASTALEESHVITPHDGKLFSVSGLFNAVASKFYLHIFDATAVPAPGAVPACILELRGDFEPSGNFFFDWGERGIPFSTGIVIAASSTLATYTPLGSNSLWFYGTRY